MDEGIFLARDEACPVQAPPNGSHCPMSLVETGLKRRDRRMLQLEGKPFELSYSPGSIPVNL